MYLGIEIGGTKLQLGVGAGDGSALVALERFDVEPAAGAAGIMAQIRYAAEPLIARRRVRASSAACAGLNSSAARSVIWATA